ncbi:hypothetical protein GGX14DRAFT_568366 [Mycena pura]|uniref:Uncharacterized protein n=1 Tax=Mycena pura TaxID=153505 RepID=A0AAD6Y800_9AGAR|nr:hypothetical protein GGX14DRAFT_568366 [Mycena pura]
MPKSKPTPRSKAGRPVKASARQQQTNENRAENAAKKQKKQDTAKRAAARKAKRAGNDAQADALRDTTNTAGESALSPEQQIALLTARLESAEAKTRRLDRKLRRQLAATNDDTEVVAIPKPKGRCNIQRVMGLGEDKAEFTRLQAAVHALAIEAKVDFDLPWSQQDHATVAKICRVAEERHAYLCAKRFPRHWATQSMLQRYINNVRAYASGKANPASGVSRRRERRATGGTRAAEEHQSPLRSLDADQMDVDDGHVSDPNPPGSRDSTPSDNDSDSDSYGRWTQDHNVDSDLDDEDEYDDEEEEGGAMADDELPVAED